METTFIHGDLYPKKIQTYMSCGLFCSLGYTRISSDLSSYSSLSRPSGLSRSRTTELSTEDIGVEISTVRLAFDSASICLLSDLDMLVVSEVNVVNKGIRVEHIREVSSVKNKTQH